MKNKIVGILIMLNIIMAICGVATVEHLYKRIEGLEIVNGMHYTMIKELEAGE